MGLVPAVTQMSEKPVFQAVIASMQSSYQKTGYKGWTVMILSLVLAVASAWVAKVLVEEVQAVPHDWQA